ncbi:acyl-CoA synthetase [Paraburkholderia sp. GAS348]|uniref:acyl-CoA synthetase n=1 Tax=Paraburkholderia sp. GAS348 TaxID=3035132 RepID=UPI003D1A8831
MHTQLTAAIRRAAQINPTGPAVAGPEGTLSWPELMRRVAQVAFGLQALGVDAGDRVAILSANSARFLELYYAVLWTGAIAVPLNTRTGPHELEIVLADCKPVVLALGGEFESLVSMVPVARSGVRHLVSMDRATAASGLLPYESLLTGEERVDAGRSGDDTAAIYYTGGTTGAPKGVMLSHANIMAHCLGMCFPLALSRSMKHLHASPMFHVADTAGIFATTMVSGTHYFVHRFDAVMVMDEIERSGITHISLVPTMINRIASSPRAREFDLSSVQTIYYGGSPMPERVIDDIISLMPVTRLVQGYGLTESSPTLSILQHEDHLGLTDRRRRRSAGQASLGVELAILDENGESVRPGENGEICARGANITAGYWNRPEQTSEALTGGWLHTGDIGFMDENGFLYVVDRIKDLIISGGENVYSIEVENLIYQHPAVQMCAVIGLPSPSWGESVHAVVSCKEGFFISAEDVLQHCRERLARYKVPKSVSIRNRDWPMSAAGKVLKTELRKEYSSST